MGDMDVSLNGGMSPQIIHFHRVFHIINHPFWWFSPYFWKPPYQNTAKECHSKVGDSAYFSGASLAVSFREGNGKLVVWVLVVWDSNRDTPQ